jgi:hypothetical protein
MDGRRRSFFPVLAEMKKKEVLGPKTLVGI